MSIPLLAFLACAPASDPQPAADAAPAAATPAEAPAVVGPPDSAWVDAEVARATAHLAEQPGGALLQRAIDAHGGMRAWAAAGTLAFDFDYVVVGKPEARRYSRSRVDMKSRRAVQVELGTDADATLGWDGKEAWIRPDAEAFPSDPRFWATTPFYFVGLPWVLADDGAQVAQLPDEVVAATGIDQPLPTLKVTYEAGVGDAPDDFYVLHLRPDDGRIAAVRYIVSYPDFHPDGGHSPEKLLVWSEMTTVDGLTFATHYDSYMWNDGKPGEVVTTVEVANFEVGKPVPVAAFSAP